MDRRFPVAAMAGVLALASCRPAAVATPTAPVAAEPPGARVSQGAHPVTPIPRPTPRSPHLALGTPRDGDDSDDVLLDRRVYVAAYHPRRHVASWVAWRLDRRDFGSAERTDAFRADTSLPAGLYRVTPADYEHSGFDRGHLCPSADRTASREDNALTFLMTNMHPQVAGLNRVTWEHLETRERQLATAGREVYVVAGGIFDAAPPTIGHGVAVPRAEFKIIVVVEGVDRGAEAVGERTEVIAVIIPNQPDVRDHEWTEYRTTVDAVEAATGYDFLSDVPEDIQRVIEAR